MIKNLLAMQGTWFNPWVGEIHWRSKWQPTPVFWPGESHGQRSLVGYSPWGHKESGMTEQLTPDIRLQCWDASGQTINRAGI